MYCIECGAKNPDHAKFCQKCGYHLAQETKESDPIKEDMPKKKKPSLVKVSSGEVWICPNCGNAVQGEYEECPYCHDKIMQIDPEGVWICPECYEENMGIYTVCSSCGYRLTSEDNPPISECIEEDNGWFCSRCGTKNVEYDNICCKCGVKKGGNITVMNHNEQQNGTGCYRHPERQAVAQCPNCGAFLCRECYNRYEGHMCKNCTYENNKAYISRVRNSLIWAAVFFVLGWIIGGAAVGSGGFLIGLWAAGLPGGFVFTNFDFFATMDMGCLGTVFYWILRLVVASVAGWIVTIVNIVRFVRAISVQKGLEDMDRWD